MLYQASAGGGFLISSVAILGGDERALWLARLMKEEGIQVVTQGLVAGDEADRGPLAVDAAILPYPFISRGGLVRGLTGWSAPLQQVLQRLPKGIALLGGAPEDDFAPPEGYLNLLDDGPLQAENAAISAEGTIMLASRHLTETMEGLSVTVTGFGLFGRRLTEKLLALGAQVLVAARSDAACEQARQLGAETCHFSLLPCRSKYTTLLLNTVPFPVIGRELLETLPPDCLLLELASAPYGIDRIAAHRLGMTLLALPGIPAQYAPQSAARALLKAVRRNIGGPIQ